MGVRYAAVKAIIRSNPVYRFVELVRSYIQWWRRQFSAPSPHLIKQTCLVRNGFPEATWIETGTFLGQTTHVLSKHATRVFSIEPEPTLFANAEEHFRGYGNVKIIKGTSEEVFPSLLPQVNGAVNFWLDGHYSAGVTFKGTQDTPIMDELKTIGENIKRFDRVCVLIDDIRCFDPSQPDYASYPSLDELVNWARQHSLRWHIEHDIFVAKSLDAAI
jgi:hypothetical protein